MITEYTFHFSAYEIVNKINHILSHKKCLNKFNRIHVTESMIFDRIKFVNNRKISKKYTNIGN